ncbi:hypothetical protein LB557_17805, partial [Mesorhizobium sp. BR115XR7A]|uniref:hypothetical protein n=1 Tax=Mesorhizobium sp. BR115XR7A TaxID=2876645 RepID=UPI001CD15563
LQRWGLAKAIEASDLPPCGGDVRQDKEGRRRVTTSIMACSVMIGLQLVGKRWSEPRLLGIARAMMPLTSGFRRPPGY